ncbi:carboxymuconolactone decarboxylase family protein [Kribbella swartbergensis]
MADLPSAQLRDLDPAFERIALGTGEFTYGLPGLSVREKLLLCLANDVCRGHLGLAFRMHVTAARQYDVTVETLYAVVRFIAPYAGYPAAADALERLAEVLGQGPNQVRPAALSSDAEPNYVTETADEWFERYLRSRTADAWAETLLSRRERAFLAIAADVANQTLGQSLRSHVFSALDAGVGPEAVRDMVRFLSEFAAFKAEAALRRLDEILADAGSGP